MARSDPRPRTKVTKAELMPGWWNGLGGRWQTWYLELAALAAQGHGAVGAAGPYHYTGIAAVIAWAQARARETHRQDADCAAFLSDDGTCCVACGVARGETPELCCGGWAFHKPGCTRA